MNIHLSHLIFNTSNHLKERILPQLTPFQKKIIAIAFIAFACLGACFFARRLCLRISQDGLNKNNLHVDENQDILLKDHLKIEEDLLHKDKLNSDDDKQIQKDKL